MVCGNLHFFVGLTALVLFADSGFIPEGGDWHPAGLRSLRAGDFSGFPFGTSSVKPVGQRHGRPAKAYTFRFRRGNAFGLALPDVRLLAFGYE